MQPLGDDEVQSLNANELKHMLKERAVKLYEAKEAEFPEPEHWRQRTGALSGEDDPGPARRGVYH